jgi:glycosyltransferase involved in cell wall biosynthesis
MSITKDVTLLITHYNRSSSLERLLISFKNLGIQFYDIVVSDDGSKLEHLNKLLELQDEWKFNLVTTPSNKGLGNNINKGQDNVDTAYTLYVQEDFIPKPLFKEKLATSLEILEERKEYDMVRYYAYFKYPFLQKFKDGFSEMIFSPSPWYAGYKKFYYYSDHPHLRRNNFFSKFGRYREGIAVEKTEYKMMMSVIKNKGKALFYENFNDLFTQENSSSEPSTVKRNYWRETTNPLVVLVRHTFRYVKFNMDYYLTDKSI